MAHPYHRKYDARHPYPLPRHHKEAEAHQDRYGDNDGDSGLRHGKLRSAKAFYHNYGYILAQGGLIDILYLGVKLGIYPCLIFMGVGAMIDFGPMLANPKTALLGGAAQFAIFGTFLGALTLSGIFPDIALTLKQAASIAIIGGADGPTSIFLAGKLAPELLGAIAVAAYSYMALVPVIQPPIMRLCTPKKQRAIQMQQLREVSKREKIIFPIMVIVLTALFIPLAIPLIGMLMFGNLLKESGVADRLAKGASNEMMNIVTIFLATSVGATMVAQNFLNLNTIKIIILGLVAFAISTAGGLLGGLVMYKTSGGTINPLIGSAGVSAVPMAARISQKVGEEALEAVIEACTGTKEQLTYEVSDMLYHLIVLLTSRGLRIEDIAEELHRRHDPSWDRKRREAKAKGEMR